MEICKKGAQLSTFLVGQSKLIAVTIDYCLGGVAALSVSFENVTLL